MATWELVNGSARRRSVENANGTYREHSENIQGTFREHSENNKGISDAISLSAGISIESNGPTLEECAAAAKEYIADCKSAGIDVPSTLMLRQ